MKHDMQTDTHEGDLVVFLLGMRPRASWRLDQALFVGRSMRRMQAEIERDRAAGGAIGYLGGFNAISATGPIVVQYWRSYDELEAYSHSTDFEHRPAWLRFYSMTHAAGRARVGIWHETFRVPAGAHESIYGDVSAPVGLAAAVGAQPLARRGRTSRERIGA